METSKLTAEGIIGEAVCIGAKMSGGEFPIEVFPIRIQRIISSLHDCQGYPVDYVAAAILAAIAVGIGNSHLVQVKRNWLESSILYMALIGRPGPIRVIRSVSLSSRLLNTTIVRIRNIRSCMPSMNALCP